MNMRKLIIGLMAACLPLAASQAGPTDWPAYGHDASGGRFSPLTQITPANASRLQVAWTYHMNPTPQLTGTRPNSTTTPLMAGGLLYVGTPYGRVVALDGTSGKQVWAYQLPGSDQPPFRGLGYWPGDATLGPRIIFGSTQGKLYVRGSIAQEWRGIVGTQSCSPMCGYTKDYRYDKRLRFASPPYFPQWAKAQWAGTYTGEVAPQYR